ncbi:MAG: hypothetical protein JOZ39_02900 [Chloroflexi bacterium]|nr:hypothetical protein [Chloroflexota bacterium]
MKVIDTLSEGFGAANRRLWIIAIPILFDLFLWLGPKATVGPGLTRLVQTGFPEQYAAYSALIEQTLASFNLFSLAAVYLPSLVVRLDATPLAAFSTDLAINSPLAFAGIALLITLGGLWLACLYLGLLAQVVRDGATNLRVMATAVWRYWSRLIGFLLLVGCALVVGAIPFGIAFVLLSSFSATAGQFLAFVIQVALIWAVVYLFFAIEALLLSDVGPLQAIKLSVAVIAGNFWASIGLIGLTFLITLGLPLAWQVIAQYPAGLVAAIVGNAYIGTGVAAAGFLFYKERLERLTAASARRTQEAQ